MSSSSGPDPMRLDYSPPPSIPRLAASGSGSGSGANNSSTMMRGLLPWPMSQFDSIPVYSLCYEPPSSATSSHSQGRKNPIQPMPCPLISHFAPPPSSSYSSSSSASSAPSQGAASVPNPPTTSSHASALDICTSRACRDIADFARLNTQSLEKYPWVVDQGIYAAAAGGARDACALSSCPHAYHAYTATVCVPLSHDKLKERGATLGSPPPGTRPDLAALLEAHAKAPDRNVAEGLGVCLSAMPLGSTCNPDAVIVHPPAVTNPPPSQSQLQGNGTLAAYRLPTVFQPPSWAIASGVVASDQDLVSGALVDGQLFVSSLWPIPRKPASTLPPMPPRASSSAPHHPIWAPVYSLTTCSATNKTTLQALMPGEPCTSTAQCAMSMCVDPLGQASIDTKPGNITGQCSRRMTKAQITVSYAEYVKALEAAQAWESAMTWITIVLMFPMLLLLMFGSMCGTERALKRCKERRRQTAGKPVRKRKKPGQHKDEDEHVVDVELGEQPQVQSPSRLTSLDRAHLEQLRLYQEIALYMRGLDPLSIAPKSSGPSPAHQQHHRAVVSPRSFRRLSDPTLPTTTPPGSQPLVLNVPLHASLPRPPIPARTNLLTAGPDASAQQSPPPTSTVTNAPHIPRPRRAAPAVTSAVPMRPVIPPRQQNASIAGIPLGARPQPALGSSGPKTASS